MRALTMVRYGAGGSGGGAADAPRHDVAEATPSAWQRVRTLARLELSDVLRSRWLLFCAGLYAVLAAAFLLVGMRESGVIGFTGMDRVLLSLSHTLVVLLPLLALTGTGLVVNRARDDGTLELLFSHPLTRGDYFAAVTIVRVGALLVPLFVLVPGLALAGVAFLDQSVPWGFLGRALAVSAALVWSFVGIGLAISALVREPAKAVMYVLFAWVMAAALLDFGILGLMLQWQLPAWAVFALAGANPVETARLALLSGAEPTLAALGPVGLWLATRLGSTWLFVAGIAWPLLVGTLAWLLGWRRFRRGDLV